MRLSDIRKAIVGRGLAYRGALHPNKEDLPAGMAVGTLVLVGGVGSQGWAAFAASAERTDGAPEPLDRWSRRMVGAMATELGGTPLFPFDGPPWLPFLRWAQKAEALHPSPIGLLVHPDWGLWHAWRGALAFDATIEFVAPVRHVSPCRSCRETPCRTACPVNAFAQGTYDVAACARHLSQSEGADCMQFGCAARRACPVGARNGYAEDQARFHMTAFRASQNGSPR